MKNKKRMIKTAVILVTLAVVLHGVHFLIFKDFHHIMLYLLGDIAFIPLDVLIVTIVIDQLLEKRERTERVKKLNMLVGLFYQELGLILLKSFSHVDPESADLQSSCKINHNWKPEHFKKALQHIHQMNKKIEIEKVDIPALTATLKEQKSLLINLIANPALLEHETFSELLMSVSHLLEELQLREKMQKKNPSYDNMDHIQIDIERVYGHLLVQWLHYVEHLKSDYPFLYSTAIATNPIYDVEDLLVLE